MKTPEPRARQAMEIFRRLVDLEPEQRSEALQELCKGDPTLHSSVSRLLDSLAPSSTFLEGSATEIFRPKLSEGAVAGYRILREVGSGGMATVYEAMQLKPSRRVALKVMKHGIASPSLLRRFEFETEVLAKLQHPSIASIYDAGFFHDGRHRVPYFAMEFIDRATPISEYARRTNLSRRQRIELFIQVCDAVEHGHRRGVIHRDLKPANVLVDESGRPRVIDFGIARSTDDGEAITQHAEGSSLIGTLSAMSPEQCEGSMADLDGRSDVYSLGVMLYELLCDRPPLDFSRLSIPEAVRRIREATPPRLSSIDASLRGDLETIVGAALQKDRNCRYHSAGALAQDLRHWLKFEAIQARPPTMRYQAKLFVRRHRVAAAAALLVIATLIAATAVSLHFAYEQKQEALERARAEDSALRQRDEAMLQAYVANVAAAAAAYQSGEFRRMRTRLTAAPEHLRGWEWHVLHSLSEPSLAVGLGHEDMLTWMDQVGDTLITTCRDGTMRTWQKEDLRPLISIQAHEGQARCVAAFPDGRRAVTVGEDAKVRVWDLQTGAMLLEISKGVSALHCVVVSTDGVIGAVDRSGRLKRWRADTGEPVPGAIEQPGGIRAAVYAPGDRQLITWGRRRDIWIRDGASGAVLRQIETEGDIERVAVSRDGRFMAAGGGDGIVWLWEVESGELIGTLRGEWGLVRSISFSPDGARLAVGHGSDRAIILWDLPTQSASHVLRGHEESITSVLFSDDGRRLFSGSWDRTLRLWDLEAPDPSVTFRTPGVRQSAVDFSSDGRLATTVGSDETVRVWDCATGEAVATLADASLRPMCLDLSPDDRLLATGTRDNRVLIWNMMSGEPTVALEAHRDSVYCVAFNGESTLLASGANDYTAAIWSVHTGALLHRLRGHTERINAVAFSPDGTLLATASRDGSVRLWDVATGSPQHICSDHDSDVFDVVFSPDGRTVYSGARDQSIRGWDVRTGAAVANFNDHGQFITSLAISPDGTRLVASSWFRQLLVIDLAAGETVAAFTAHDGVVRGVRFDRSGRRLATASFDGTVRIWDALDAAGRRAETERCRRDDAAMDALLAEPLPADSDELVADLLPRLGSLPPTAACKALLRRSDPPLPAAPPADAVNPLLRP